MATTRQASPPRSELETPANWVSHLELVELFQRRAVYEPVVVEIALLFYRLEVIIAYRMGRWTLMAAKRLRNFRGLETLARRLVTMGMGHTIIRLELLT